MADAKTTTLTLDEIDALAEIQRKIEYIRTFTDLIIHNPSYGVLPSHNQIAIDALSRFACDADDALRNIRNHF